MEVSRCSNCLDTSFLQSTPLNFWWALPCQRGPEVLSSSNAASTWSVEGSSWRFHSFSTISSIILAVTYGIQVKHRYNPYIDIAERPWTALPKWVQLAHFLSIFRQFVCPYYLQHWHTSNYYCSKIRPSACGFLEQVSNARQHIEGGSRRLSIALGNM